MKSVVLISALLWLFGHPIFSILILLLLLYWLDRMFIGLSPSLLKPWRRMRRFKKLQSELALNAHHVSNKLEMARILMERKQYAKAKSLLEEVIPVMPDSAEVLYEKGLCELKTGNLEAGEAEIRKALEMNPRVKYGEPYLRLAEALGKTDPDRALEDLERFKEQHSSSCEAYFRLGLIYEQLGRTIEAKEAYKETVQIYRSLPKYKRKSERKWALLAGLKR